MSKERVNQGLKIDMDPETTDPNEDLGSVGWLGQKA